jgi:hypothetical protein
MAWAGLAACAHGQSVTAPAVTGAKAQAQLVSLAAKTPQPADRSRLDDMLASGRFGELKARLAGVSDPPELLRDLNWEQRKVFDGSGYFTSWIYMNDLWRYASAPGIAGGEAFKARSAMMFLYNLAVIRIDAARCVDQSAPGHRFDQLLLENQGQVAALRSLPIAERVKLADEALTIEAATAPLRRDDTVLCGGGMASMMHALQATEEGRKLAAKPLGSVSGAVALPADPTFRPAFAAPETWRPVSDSMRQKMPEYLQKVLAKLDAPAARTSAPASQTPAIRQVDWLRRPSPADVSRYYPDRAERMGIDGRASIRCHVGQDSSLSLCEVIAEEPLDFGFGQAALDMVAAGLFQMRVAGAVAPNTTVVLPIAFSIARPAATPAPSPPP